MKKKLIVLFFLLCASLLAVLIFSACGGDGDSGNGGNSASGLTYRLKGDYYIVTGLSEDADVTEIVIPAVYNGKPVREIASDAFWDEIEIVSATIPASVTRIGKYAFCGCDSLESISIPFVGEKADGSGATHFGWIFGASDYDEPV